jgi:hypothetical protein
MDWITESVAIGNCVDAQDKDLLLREGIRSAVSFDGTLTLKNTEKNGKNGAPAHVCRLGNKARCSARIAQPMKH